jgi:hypothetical protein
MPTEDYGCKIRTGIAALRTGKLSDSHRALKLYDVMADDDVKHVMPEGTSHKQKNLNSRRFEQSRFA